jgi:hypothetical protein
MLKGSSGVVDNSGFGDEEEKAAADDGRRFRDGTDD